jgi:bifunctional non-homologous end joining protein LigD
VRVAVLVERRHDFDTNRPSPAAWPVCSPAGTWSPFTTALAKDDRRGLLFLDTGRNACAQHAVAPYAVRARPGAPIALAVDWDELDGGFDPQRWTVPAAARRIASKADPWAELPRDHQRLSPARRAPGEIRAAGHRTR